MELLFALLVIVVVGCAVIMLKRGLKEDGEETLCGSEKSLAQFREEERVRREKEEEEQRRLEEERKRQQEEQRREAEQKLKEEFFASYTGKRLTNAYRWMCLAGGTDPFLLPCISFSPADWTISIEKKGYDLWIENLQQYYHGTVWEEREAALKRFEKDLFKDKLDEVRDIINAEFIADHLITLENCRRYEADFTLKWSEVVSKDFFSTYTREFVRETLQSVSFQYR